ALSSSRSHVRGSGDRSGVRWTRREGVPHRQHTVARRRNAVLKFSKLLTRGAGREWCRCLTSFILANVSGPLAHTVTALRACIPFEILDQPAAADIGITGGSKECGEPIERL